MPLVLCVVKISEFSILCAGWKLGWCLPFSTELAIGAGQGHGVPRRR